MTNYTETLEHMPTVLNDTSSKQMLASTSNSSLNPISDECMFVRGDPSTRLSTNIKRMFKSVIEHQTSAIQTLEKFYECQINRIEMERTNMLSIACEDQKERINMLYDHQLTILEQRVQTNLMRLLNNKVFYLRKTMIYGRLPNMSHFYYHLT